MWRDLELCLHNKQPANLERLCFWLPDSRYPQPDLHEYYAPRTPTEIKNPTWCLCTNRLLASKNRGTQTQLIFPKSGSSPFPGTATEANAEFSLKQFLGESNPTSPSTRIQQNPSYTSGGSLLSNAECLVLITLIESVSSRS